LQARSSPPGDFVRESTNRHDYRTNNPSCMKPALIRKLARIRENSASREFILADAKDADMAWGVPSAGEIYPRMTGRARHRTMPEFHEQIREVVRQGIVDILLASTSTMSRLAHQERLFDKSNVTPAIRANDTSDVWLPRGGKYREHPSLPFSSSYIEEAQFGSVIGARRSKPVVNLGLYSMTYNNDARADLETQKAFREFRAEARRKGFNYFLEVFPPNVNAGLGRGEIPSFVNDHICRTLAGVSLPDRPAFLKVPFFGPRALEELAAYDPSMVLGVMGGGNGTTYDAFKLLADAQKYGARVALYGRKIKAAEDPLTFIVFLRRIVEGEITAKEAVKAYHGELKSKKIHPRRSLAADMKITDTSLNY